MRCEQHDTILDGLDARKLAGLATVAEDAQIAECRADSPVVAPIRERLEQLAELVQVGAHLQAGDTGLLIDDAEKAAGLERQLEEVANVLALGRGMQFVDALDASPRGSKVGLVEPLHGGV